MELSVGKSVENVYIFVADALRYDSVPSTLEQQGTLVKTASSSPLSCSAFSSLVSGKYPPQHGVWSFSHLLGTEQTIFDLFPGESPFRFGVRAVTDSVDSAVHYSSESSFTEAIHRTNPPFLVVDRDLSAHAPYGYDMASPETPDEQKQYTSLSQYWSSRAADPSSMKEDYQRGAQMAYSRFESRIDALREKGVLDDTLVIVTADHGEVLGEHGMYGHAPSLVSESVYVPTLFYDGGVQVDVSGDFMAQVDLFPTLCALKDRPFPDNLPGYNLLEGAPDDRLVFNAKRRRYTSWGAWDKDGGHAFSDHGFAGKILSGVNRLIRTDDAKLNRRRPLQVLRTCYNRDRCFGAPNHSREEARQFCNRVFSGEIESTRQRLDQTAREQLEALGYTESEIEG